MSNLATARSGFCAQLVEHRRRGLWVRVLRALGTEGISCHSPVSPGNKRCERISDHVSETADTVSDPCMTDTGSIAHVTLFHRFDTKCTVV
ncbi:hypothetical protein EYF80_001516 [Liparis tanakae]|uniref:Uncharacterized protein n=1 Tax=Liparis tanakae TaxID=230148 RepID=A0A4Z2JDQ0_9TELE|nr:hypothetical protein EYF80_001516 [Liparis tanakae]